MAGSAFCLRFWRCAISILALVAGAFAQTSESVSLASTPNPSVYGYPVTLTATLTGGETGKVSFFDGVTVLGTSTISGTQAVFTTSLRRIS
jgi:hypothetical protein